MESSVKSNMIEEINKANDGVAAYVENNGLREAYDESARKFAQPEPTPSTYRRDSMRWPYRKEQISLQRSSRRNHPSLQCLSNRPESLEKRKGRCSFSGRYRFCMFRAAQRGIGPDAIRGPLPWRPWGKKDHLSLAALRPRQRGKDDRYHRL